MTNYKACAAIEGFDGLDHTKEEIVEAFQHLIDTGAAWTLQGFYGRNASRPLEPWQLQHYAGRVDRFSTQSEAATEAKKTWPGCHIHKTGGRES